MLSRRLTTAAVSSEQTYAVFFLPPGRQQVRVSAAVGSQTGMSDVYTVRVGRPRGWTTSRKDVGRYTGKAVGLDVELGVAKRGRSVRRFRADVSTFCPGATVDQNRILIGLAPFARAKVAPDGRFYSITRPASETVVETYGRIRNGRVRGTVRLTIGGCDGIADYSVKLRR